MAATGGFHTSGAILCTKYGKKLSETDVEFLSCSYCDMVLRNPFQLEGCGHRYCQICLESIFKCPVDGQAIVQNELINDRACQKEIASLRSTCILVRRGCTWQGPLSDLENHTSRCMFVFKTCPACGVTILRLKMDIHISKECPNVKVKCEYLGCPEMVLRCQSSDHFSQHVRSAKRLLANTLLEVERCYGDNLILHHQQEKLLEELSSSQTRPTPDLRPLPSPPRMYTDIWLLLSTDDCSLQHLQRVMEALSNTMLKLRRLTDNSILLHHQQERLQKEAYISQRKAFPGPDLRLPPNDGEEPHQGKPSSFEANPGSILSDRGYTSRGSSLSVQLSMQHSFHQNQMQLVGYIEPVQKHMAHVPHTLQQSVARVDEIAQGGQETVTRHAVSMEGIKLRQDILDIKSTTGVFVWKIPDIRKHFKDAVEHRTLSLYSPPFHITPHGYRMCIRTYLNGDGSGKGTHLSVFFVLMRSENDSLLRWPFAQQVTFTLVNQMFPFKSVSSTFHPDTRSPSFQQPQSEMNIASGFPRFKGNSVLNDVSYTKENTLFIRCHVDTTGLPESW